MDVLGGQKAFLKHKKRIVAHCREGTRNCLKQAADCDDPDMALRRSSWRLWWIDHYDSDEYKKGRVTARV